MEDQYQVAVKRPVGRPRTRPDTPEIQAERERDLRYKTAKYVRVKDEIYEALGGKCAITGRTDNLELHHIRRNSDKSHESLHKWSYGDYITETVRECVLLCSGWHTKIHRMVDEEFAEVTKMTDLTNPDKFKDYLCEKITLREIRRAEVTNKLKDI